MGATGWSYFAPYEVDVATALQRLREKVFKRGDYVFGHGLPPEEYKKIMSGLRPQFESMIQSSLKSAEDPNLPEHFRAAHREMAKAYKRELELSELNVQQPKKKPKTINELLKLQADSGTHSILDIVSVSTKPKFRTVSPFPKSKLKDFFNTETPNHAEVEEAFESGALEEFVSRRWQGFYIVIYHNGCPSELFFAGCSGD
jgi:hypothetical protein